MSGFQSTRKITGLSSSGREDIALKVIFHLKTGAAPVVNSMKSSFLDFHFISQGFNLKQLNFSIIALWNTSLEPFSVSIFPTEKATREKIFPHNLSMKQIRDTPKKLQNSPHQKKALQIFIRRAVFSPNFIEKNKQSML
jgi:hypothetical protein